MQHKRLTSWHVRMAISSRQAASIYDVAILLIDVIRILRRQVQRENLGVDFIRTHPVVLLLIQNLVFVSFGNQTAVSNSLSQDIDEILTVCMEMEQQLLIQERRESTITIPKRFWWL